jgi:hypothetical protein
MRKWSFILFCLTALIGLVVLVGCEGDTGLTGGKGTKGRQGTPGYDPDRLAPADREFMFAVTNKSENDANGKRRLILTFDSTARATKDTVVASRVSIPPLLDGIDGEEYEWGAQKSKMPLVYLNADDPGELKNAKLKNGVVRVAYDDDNIYFQFQWQEQPIKNVASVGESAELKELLFSYRRGWKLPIVTYSQGCVTKAVEDTTYTFVKVKYDSICGYPKNAPPEECQCWDTRGIADTTYLWVPRDGSGEDRLVVFFPKTVDDGWQDVALKQFFGYKSLDISTPSGFFADVWSWGAARTSPVGVADDWYVDGSGAQADAGQAPYVDNWSPSDSVPRYMSRWDPNLRTSQAAKQSVIIYPLWYYDAVPYSRYGWIKGTFSGQANDSSSRRIDSVTVSLPGVITSIPSESRADVYATARFDNSGGYWTVEIKRARRTHNLDDVQF